METGKIQIEKINKRLFIASVKSIQNPVIEFAAAGESPDLAESKIIGMIKEWDDKIKINDTTNP